MKPQRSVEKRLMGDDPLATDSILERFYKPEANVQSITPITDAPMAKEKPTHYKVVCISLYNEDIENLERMVAELKRRGHTKANKSQLIRAALAQVDLAKIPKGF
jgi:hypothetical protein